MLKIIILNSIINITRGTCITISCAFHVHISSTNYEESGYNLNLNLLPCCTNRMFHILGKVG